MRQIKNMTPANTVNDDDVRNISSELEATSGPYITMRVINTEEYTIPEIKANLDPIVSVEVPFREVGGDHIAYLKSSFLTKGID